MQRTFSQFLYLPLGLIFSLIRYKIFGLHSYLLSQMFLHFLLAETIKFDELHFIFFYVP